jgi:hypothetical protein
MLYASANATGSPKEVTDRRNTKNGSQSKESSHSIGRKNSCFHSKFECELSIPFTRKIISRKSGTFSWGHLEGIIRAEAKLVCAGKTI